MKIHFLTSVPLACLALTTASQASTVYVGTGSNAAGLQGTVDSFRSALGNGSTSPNSPDPVNVADGFRAINWDAAPDGISDPNSFPGDFFNANVSPRARGMSFSTSGTGFALSATTSSGTAINFTTFNATYASEFQTFSPERLFAPLGSNIVDVSFFNPVDPTQGALVDGFGAVFVDVDVVNLSRIEYFDSNNNLITTAFAEAEAEGLSFAGVHFDTEGEILARARIHLGNGVLGDNDTALNDVVVLDDFIAGEPTVVPEPSVGMLLGVCSLLALSRRRRK